MREKRISLRSFLRALFERIIYACLFVWIAIVLHGLWLLLVWMFTS